MSGDEQAFKRERDAIEAWKTGPIEEPPELIDPVREELSDADQPLTGDELDTIKARAESKMGGYVYPPEREAALRLVAEIERLQAQVADAHELANEWAEMEPKIVALMEHSDYVSELRAALNDAPQP